jgi:hypothetical protein
VSDPHAAAWARVAQAITEPAGALPPSVRRGIRNGDDPADLAPLLDKVRCHAHRIVDADLPPARSDDEVFEAVLAAALGASEALLRAGLGAL